MQTLFSAVIQAPFLEMPDNAPNFAYKPFWLVWGANGHGASQMQVQTVFGAL